MKMTLKPLFRYFLYSAMAAIGVVLIPMVQVMAAEEIMARPGRLFDVGTHRLHMHCLGEGQPTVVLDAGLGGMSLEWAGVQQLLSQLVRVCAYDRAGYGWSESGPMPRTSTQNVDELFVLLQQANIPGPYVLVGHSYGGYNIQLFASRYQDVTAGLVLIDASHPDQIARFQAPPIGVNTVPNSGGTILRYSIPTLPANLPDDFKPTVHRQLLNAKTRVAAGSEYVNFRKGAAQVQETGPLPNVPLVVVTRVMRVWPRTQRGDLMEQLWMDLQTELAAGSLRSAHFIVDKSGHHIHLDQPELVANAIALTVNTAQKFCHCSPRNTRAYSLANTTHCTFKNATWLSNHLSNGTAAETLNIVWQRRLSNYLMWHRRFSNYELPRLITPPSTEEKSYKLSYQ